MNETINHLEMANEQLRHTLGSATGAEKMAAAQFAIAHALIALVERLDTFTTCDFEAAGHAVRIYDVTK